MSGSNLSCPRGRTRLEQTGGRSAKEGNRSCAGGELPAWPGSGLCGLLGVAAARVAAARARVGARAARARSSARVRGRAAVRAAGVLAGRLRLAAVVGRVEPGALVV